MTAPPFYRHFSWEHSYFSGKTRAYLRYKQRMDDLGAGFEDILATSDLIQGLLLPQSGTAAVPQLEAPDGTWVQDTAEMIDYCEAAHAKAPVIPGPDRPRQRIASYLVELLADEWMVVHGFWERWHFSLDGASPNHRHSNEQQWGVLFAPDADGAGRRDAAKSFFEIAFGISEARTAPRGVYAGLLHLGCDEETEAAWEASALRIFRLLEDHFAVHDFTLGGQPALGDFGLLAPLYAHIFRDAVPGGALHLHFPLVAEWVERTNGVNALNARTYDQSLYSLDDDGKLVPRPATSDGGAWLPDDHVPETLMPILGVFFEEMWPALESSLAALTDFISSDQHTPGSELPAKTFTATPGFEALQTGDGPLTHDFTLGSARGRRMVTAHHAWRLQRIADALAACTPNGRDRVAAMLAALPGGENLLKLDEKLSGCRVRKEGGRLFSRPD
ncbi:MAG: hypothetical protein VX574_07735 [Myxococcota bacterium]|nr:hypothetical protein [Myxococcota bacterium]